MAFKMGSSTGNGIHHSESYHSFFEGYSECRVPRKNGKGTKIKRIYIREYYQQNLPAGKQVILRISYFVLYLLAVFCFVFSSSLNTAANSTWYSAIAQCLSAITCVTLFIVLLLYLFSCRRLTIGQYRSSSIAFQKNTFWAALAYFFHMTANGIYMLSHYSLMIIDDWLNLFALAAGTLILFGMNRIEKKITYITLENNNQGFEDGNEIW